MKNIILIVFLFLSTFGYSQKIRVAQETEYIASGKSGAFRLQSGNEQLVKDIFELFKGKISKVDQVIKKDRKGEYIQTTFHFKQEYYNEVVKFLNNLNNQNK